MRDWWPQCEYTASARFTFNKKTSLVTQISKPLILEPFQRSIHEHLSAELLVEICNQSAIT